MKVTLRVTTSMHYTFEVEAESAAAAVEQFLESDRVIPDDASESDSFDVEAIEPNGFHVKSA